MKLHKNLCGAIVSGLVHVFADHGHASQVLEQLLLTDKRWGARDRNFIAENFYFLIRYYRLYCFGAGIEAITTAPDAWLLLGASFIDKNVELPAWDEWTGINVEDVKKRLKDGRAVRKIRESIPDWLDEEGSAALGAIWEDEIHSLNQQAPLFVRVNTIKATKENVKEFLDTEGIEYEFLLKAENTIIIHSKKGLSNKFAYKNGWFEIQDLSSQLVAPALEAQPGMFVIDACAGAGGKALHIGAMMKNEGTIIAMDLYPDKLKELETRARRNGVTIIKSVVYSTGMESNYKAVADRLLLDVPCSATGVMRRNPDTKWKLSKDELIKLIETQQDILNRYNVMLKPGGIMVYATCSVLPLENEKQIEKFLSKHADFTKIQEQRVSPRNTTGDGFYICKLIKS